MKILIIYGTGHVGNTHKAVSIFKEELLQHEKIEFNEITLPNDLSDFCLGCHNCIKKSEDLCRSSKSVQMIIEKINDADAIIVSSPVYVLGMTAALKNMFDHLGYSWLVHRPNVNFFGKKTMVITTAAGGGTKKCIKDIQTNLKWLGFKVKNSLGINIAAWSWNEMSSRDKKEEKVKKSAKAFYKQIVKNTLPRQTLFSTFLLKVLSSMVKNYPDDNIDKKYWKLNNWI